MKKLNKGPVTLLSHILMLAMAYHAGPSRGGVIRHDRSPCAYRDLGAKSAFGSVGEVALRTASGRPMKASCVLIAPEWALTVAHCVLNKEWMALEDYRFVFGGQSFQAARIVIHPDVDRKTGAVTTGLAKTASGADLALVKLTKPVRNVQPAVRYRGCDEIGKVMTKVGHGMVGDGVAGIHQPFVQERRGGNNVIDAAGGTFGDLVVSDRVLLADFDSPSDSEASQLGDSKPLKFEIGGSPGDSGGGWFIRDDRDGRAWKLVAVTSGWVPHDGNPYNTENNTAKTYGTIAAGMRVSALNAWIDGVIGMPSQGQSLIEEPVSRDESLCR